MTRDEAVRQVKTYLGDMGVDSPGLGADDWGGIELPEGSVLFEYQAAGTLRASALVYRFARPPSERLRAAFLSDSPDHRILATALWLREHNGGHVNRAVAVNAFNAFMCGAIAASIAWLRWLQPGAAFPTLF